MTWAPPRPASRIAAKELLESWKLPVKDVIDVDVDSIVWIGTDDRPRTTWITTNSEGKTLRVRTDYGFVAEMT